MTTHTSSMHVHTYPTLPAIGAETGEPGHVTVTHKGRQTDYTVTVIDGSFYTGGVSVEWCRRDNGVSYVADVTACD